MGLATGGKRATPIEQRGSDAADDLNVSCAGAERRRAILVAFGGKPDIDER